jgi:hypothetical protein
MQSIKKIPCLINRLVSRLKLQIVVQYYFKIDHQRHDKWYKGESMLSMGKVVEKTADEIFSSLLLDLGVGSQRSCVTCVINETYWLKIRSAKISVGTNSKVLVTMGVVSVDN